MSPASSQAQKLLMCIALSIKRGKTPKEYSKEAAKLAETMSLKDLADFCREPVKKD